VKCRPALTALCATITLGLIAPTVACAGFTRPFLREITETPAGPLAGPGGLSIDPAGKLWIGETKTVEKGKFRLDQFDSAGVFLKTLEVEGAEPPIYGTSPPRNLAIDTSGNFYVANSEGVGAVEVFDNGGTFTKRWQAFGRPSVAVDNSNEPSAGTVYVDHGSTNPKPPYGDESVPGIEKFSASGSPKNFTASAPYILGNEIHGTASGNWEQLGSIEFWSKPSAVTVDSHGDIYSVDNAVTGGGVVVDEYAPSGAFLRTFRGEETPGLNGLHYEDGFGGKIYGVAFDSASDHLLVSVAESREVAPHKTGYEGAVDEFEVSTGHFVSQILETSEGHLLNRATEMAVDSHGDLYLVDSITGVVDVFGPGHFLPSFKSAEVTEAKAASVVLNGFVDPEGFALNDCHFEYVTDAAFKATGFSDLSSGGTAPCVPAATSLPADSEYHPVYAKITDHVQSGITYHYRLLATTSGALGGTGETAALEFTVPHAPQIDSTTEDNLSSGFADVHALIDPLGADTTYRFEYVDQAHYEPAAEDPYAAGTTVPTTPVDIGSGGSTGSADASVLQHIGGLIPGTAYHFRVVATNEVGTTDGPDQTFTTLPRVSPGLPDNRAYELLTPPNKGDAEDMFAPSGSAHDEFAETEYGAASESGDAFLFKSYASFGSSPASGENGYVFSRGSSGWSFTPLAVPSLGVQSVSPDVYDPADLSEVGVEDQVGSVASPTGTSLTSLLGPPGGPYATLNADPPSGHNEFEELNTHIVGASHDLGHVVLESLDHTLAPGAEGDSGAALYEYSGSGLNLLNVNSEGAPVSPCGAMLGQSHIPGTSHNAVSADGSRVFFTAPDPYAENQEGTGGCWNGKGINAPQLYLRAGNTTTELSAPEENAPDSTANHPAVYVGASEDGSRVFFISQGELTEDNAGVHDSELYEYDVNAGKLTRVSAGEFGAGAGVLTVPAISADGSTVYFTASGRLTAGAPASIGGGEADLYRYDTNTHMTVYIATVSRNDYPTESLSGWGPTPWVALIPDAEWYTTPDGRYLLFATKSDLTGYSTAEASPGDCPEPNGLPAHGHCQEVYRYDSATGELACLSCNPSGAPPTSNASFADSARYSIQWGAGPVRAMSNDGSYAFFDTGDALVPQDDNGKLDVYEWHEGGVSLISTGKDSSPSFFLGASADGSNVFFGTHARLVSADADSAGDLYDARICTGSDPCVKAAAGETAQCEGDACQNSPPAPIDATPGSLTFSGAGDLLGAVAPTATPKTKTDARATVSGLEKALKACGKKPRKKRHACERQARKKYAPIKKGGKR
jgi:hypothetical protein